MGKHQSNLVNALPPDAEQGRRSTAADALRAKGSPSRVPRSDASNRLGGCEAESAQKPRTPVRTTTAAFHVPIHASFPQRLESPSRVAQTARDLAANGFDAG